MLANKEQKDKIAGKDKKGTDSNVKEEPTLKVMTAALKEIDEADSDSSLFTPS
jgi:hypothetical protein